MFGRLEHITTRLNIHFRLNGWLNPHSFILMILSFLSEVLHAIWSVQCGTHCACGQDVSGHDRTSIWDELAMRPAWSSSGTLIQMDDFTSFHCTTYCVPPSSQCQYDKTRNHVGTNLLNYEFLVWSMTYLTSQSYTEASHQGAPIWSPSFDFSFSFFSSIYTNIPSVMF